MSKQSVVTGINVNIGGQKHELSLEQARELRDALSEILGDKVVEVEHHHHHDRVVERHPYPVPYVWPKRHWEITWTTGGTTAQDSGAAA